MGRLGRPHHLDPELLPKERLLLAIGKLDPSPRDRVLAHELIGNATFSWRDTFALAVAHRVHPMLAHNLESDPSLKSRVPGEFHRSLRAFRAVAVMRRELYIRALAPIVAALAADKVSLVLLKGAALAETVYPAGTRLLNDFDILIRKSDYRRVTAAFVKAGFSKRLRTGQTEAYELENYHQIGFDKREGESFLSVDLHWLLYPTDRAFCQIDTPALMARAKRVPFGTASSLVLSREDMLVHYASQLVNDSLYVTYQRMGDIYALARHSMCWESATEVASRAGSGGATHLALSIASMLGADVPSRVFRVLRSQCAGCHVPSQYLAVPSLAFRRHEAPFAVPILTSLLYSRQRDRIRYLRLFVSARWEVSRRSKGTLRSCLTVARRIRQLARWGVELLLARMAPWGGARHHRRLENSQL